MEAPWRNTSTSRNTFVAAKRVIYFSADFCGELKETIFFSPPLFFQTNTIKTNLIIE
jgi:hypothetical protein